MTKTDQYFEELPSLENSVSIDKTSNLFNKYISMTSFWLVQRQPLSGKTDILTATPVKNTSVAAGHEYVNVDERQNRRSRKNAERISHAYQKTRYTSQIGLIYLKPVVHYSTSVYFHSNNDFPEEPRSPKDVR